MNLRSTFLAIGLVIIWSCSDKIRVKSDYDKDVNLSLYKTYAWLPIKDIETKNNPLVYNELTDKRIKKAVDLQMQAKKIYYSLDSPSLRIHYHIIIENKTVVQPNSYGYNYSTYWLSNKTSVYHYREGTLIIDLMDARTNNLVWRGWAISALDNDIDLTEDEINIAVYKILGEFPVTK